ncbi:serine protease gd-like [Temnothorax longispinosus]|uniref:serine protease gd-like n=1 Tax=Temnothorax longispinosus TaxID=300112 RepID=UPI003A9A5105
MIKIFISSVLLPHLVYTILIVRSTTETIRERNTNNNDECGITSYYTDSTNNLIANGEYALPGQWPWVVALNLDNQFGFQCAGSILTDRHILTARKCLEPSDVIHNNMTVSLGQFKLSGERVVGTVNRKVASYKFHPDANWYYFVDSDLAILVLETPVVFSPFIRPICLWSSSTDLENVVDRTGYIVGWVKQREGRIIVSEPRMLRMSIVNQETCLRSYENLTNYTPERTFCGDVGTGLLGENRPCFGDMGSGLVLFDNSTGRYHLRGILSRQNTDWCGVGKYIVYVDVAKYIPWIQQQISTT